jgi:hypothetical protein
MLMIHADVLFQLPGNLLKTKKKVLPFSAPTLNFLFIHFQIQYSFADWRGLTTVFPCDFDILWTIRVNKNQFNSSFSWNHFSL